MTLERSHLLLTALSSSIEAGKAILEVYASDFKVDYKDDRSPLTQADRRSHEIISRCLVAAGTARGGAQFPILSEEGKEITYAIRKSWDTFWLVDPLDGTKEFLKRNGEFTVNIALIEGARPVMGVIFAPVLNVVYYAWRGLGSYRLNIDQGFTISGDPADHIRSERKLREILDRSQKLAPLAAPVPGARISAIGSRSHGSEEFNRFVETLRKTYDPVEIISAGSSLKFCLVAEGKADLYPRFGPTMEWDTAAGQIIAEEAGAVVRKMDSDEPLVYNKESLLNPWFMVESRSSRIPCSLQQGASNEGEGKECKNRSR